MLVKLHCKSKKLGARPGTDLIVVAKLTAGQRAIHVVGGEGQQTPRSKILRMTLFLLKMDQNTGVPRRAGIPPRGAPESVTEKPHIRLFQGKPFKPWMYEAADSSP
jgi:hypothetical protein